MPSTALLFSGGRDSLVLKHILDPYLDDIVIVWVNTGAAYESTLKQMRQIQSSVPHFYEVLTDQPADIVKWGYPTDVLPLRHSDVNFGYLTPKLQSTTSCCAKNIWYPIKLALKDLGVTHVYSGAREDEDMKDPRWIEEIDGVRYRWPLRKWTLKMVLDYVKKHNIMLPPYYHEGEEKSRDCWNCTGYLWERKVSISRLPENQKALVQARLQEIEDVIHNEMEHLKILL